MGHRDRDSELCAPATPQVTLPFLREGWVAQTWMGNLIGFEKLHFGVPLTGPSVQSHMKLLTEAPHGQGCGVTYIKHLRGLERWLHGCEH